MTSSNVTVSREVDRDQRKNAYYRDGFRNMIWIAHIQVAFILVLSSLLMFYVTRAERLDRYFATNIESRSVEMYSLDSPNMEKTTITNWAERSVAQVMTFGFNDVEKRFASSISLFTKQGWDSFEEALLKSGMLEDMQDKQLVFTAVPLKTSVLVKEGLVVDRYTWEFDIWLLITYRAGKKKGKVKKKVNVIVERIPTRENPAGIGISEWYIY